MSKRRSTSRLPEPPWSFSPSEVAEWMGSTAGPKARHAPGPRRQARVKAFAATGPISSERRLLRRLEDLGFERVEGPHPEGVLARLTGSSTADDFRGTLGGTQVRIRLRKGALLAVHGSFSPRLSLRRASKLLDRLGLRGLDVRWT